MRSYGFYHKSVPLIFTIEGELIGDGAEFVEHVRERYAKVIGMTKEAQKARLEENKKLIADKHRKEHHGLSLREKITKATNSKKQKDTIETITDSFFEECEVEGRHMYSRTTNL